MREGTGIKDPASVHLICPWAAGCLGFTTLSCPGFFTLSSPQPSLVPCDLGALGVTASLFEGWQWVFTLPYSLLHRPLLFWDGYLQPSPISPFQSILPETGPLCHLPSSLHRGFSHPMPVQLRTV